MCCGKQGTLDTHVHGANMKVWCTLAKFTAQDYSSTCMAVVRSCWFMRALFRSRALASCSAFLPQPWYGSKCERL